MSRKWGIEGEERAVQLLVLASGQLEVRVGEESQRCGCIARGEGLFDLILEDRCVRMHVVPDGNGGFWVHDGDRAHHVEPAQGRQRDLGVASGSGRIIAPMPGKLIQVLVTVGDLVEVGQPVAILEAMKMEQQLRADVAGTVSEIGANAGDQVEMNALLVRIVTQQPEDLQP
jgi:biotin carboxyl carrier protein